MDVLKANLFQFRFQAGSDDTALLLEGWSAPEAGGTWSLGSSRKLRLQMPKTSGTHSVSLVFTLFRTLLKSKTVRVLSGDKILFQSLGVSTDNEREPCER